MDGYAELPIATAPGDETAARFHLFAQDPEWEGEPRALGWVKSAPMADAICLALTEAGFESFYMEGT